MLIRELTCSIIRDNVSSERKEERHGVIACVYGALSDSISLPSGFLFLPLSTFGALFMLLYGRISLRFCFVCSTTPPPPSFLMPSGNVLKMHRVESIPRDVMKYYAAK